ncbi:stage II sporulation protein M [Bacillus mycoides]|uniref:stage II sporulation protein M n=1 Tax=Bacillus mycoides TaxID=1405 RepID=UPI003D65A528
MNYKLFWYRNRRIILASIIIYILGIILGLVFSDILQTDPPTKGIKANLGFLHFTYHNLLANILTCFSFFTFGIFTIVLIIYNGFLIGISSIHSIEQGHNLLYVICALLPHGIFEIPAFIFAGAIGFKGLDFILKKITGKKVELFFRDIFTMLLVIFILTCIAATIEANITPMILNKLS